ncbi:MAG: hypothetical protein MK066_05260 [Crocinitomicaceae bacterium]|nr:hypothetical protein [Crocinitomicaceae bacterium]
MDNKRLHIIALDVPFPTDYGGAIDIYYRVKALHKLGFKIQLHCYEYGRGTPSELNDITENVYYYPRKKRSIDLFNSLPFIVQTRRSKLLLDRLLQDDSPILFEGLHTTFHLKNPALASRNKIVRTHNIEHVYYHDLAKEARGWKKSFFLNESKKLKRYESILSHANYIISIKQEDQLHFSQYQKNTFVLPASMKKLVVIPSNAKKDYALFHGNLSVPENERSAKRLLNEVLPLSDVQVILAGKNPSDELIKLAESKGVEIIPNPDQKTMDSLIQNARVHLLSTDQSTGVKLKLLYSIMTYGQIIVSPEMTSGTSLDQWCNVVNSPAEWKETILEAFRTNISTSVIEARHQFMEEHFNTEVNCQLIIELLSKQK